MTFLESLSLMLGLLFCASLLYHSNKKWGALATISLTVAALVSSAVWPLLAGAAVAAAVVLLGQLFYPEVVRGEGRENAVRNVVQHFFALSMLLVGVQYCLYHWALLNGYGGILTRPDVVDAFLPIAGGVELKAIFTLGYWDTAHPAAAVMLATVMLSAIVCKRAFCGWACPLGLAGDYLHRLRQRIIPGDAHPPKWIDWPLRSIKYLLLLALLYVISSMPTGSLRYYLNGNYHQIADAKMGLFFLQPSVIALVVIIVILALAAWQKQAFCRYVCPYGAGLAMLSFLSPLKIRRQTEHCLIESKGMKCDKCTRACPARINVHKQINVRSDECQACLRCVSACPKKEALGLSTRWGTKVSSKGVVMLLVLMLFVVPLIAYLGGFWHSDVTDAMRLKLLPFLDMIGH